METILSLTFILVLAELFEAYMQRSKTLLGVLDKLYVYYRKSIFLFFLIQPGFYVILFIIVWTEVLNLSMVFLLAIKIFDIFYKLDLIKKVFIEKQITVQIAQILEWKMPSWYFLLGVFTYPPLLYYALIG
jgi:hypothetical protein